MSSAGEIPVLLCGVILYLNRKRDNFVSTYDPSLSFLIPSLKVCTARSTKPFDAGWYGGVLTCRTLLRLRKSANSSLVKFAALSETITSGRPSVANVVLNRLMVAADELDVVLWTLRLSIDYHQKHLPHKGASVVDVNPGPRLDTPRPSMHRGYWWRFSMYLTRVARFDTLLDSFVNPWPPSVSSGQPFHAINAWVSFM